MSKNVQSATHILATARPAVSGTDPFLSAHGGKLCAAENLQGVCYLSSTGAYGDHSGEWVSEETAPNSPGSSGTARVLAEKAWTAAVSGSASQEARLGILRLAGIYGYGRSALDTLLKKPITVDLDNDATVAAKLISRVHTDDIVAAILAFINSQDAQGLYNVADDEPASRAEVFAYARELLRSGAAGRACSEQLQYMEGLTTSLSAPVSLSRRDLERASKRVLNRKLRGQLVPELSFPSYREGLDSIAAAYAKGDLPVNAQADS